MSSFPVRRNVERPLASPSCPGSGGDGGDGAAVRSYNSSASSSSSTSSSDYEYLNLFHKFDHLQRSPLAGLYNVIVHNTPQTGDVQNASVAPPTITVSSPQELPSPTLPLSPSSPPSPPRPIQKPSTACSSQVQVIGREIRQEMPPVATQRPYVEITEQPHPKALRFRYECEGRSAGSIPGVNTTTDHKTYPAIQIHGYRGRAVVVVSCVTKGEMGETKEEPKYKPHPHNLVGKEGCKKGVCTVEINCTTMSYTFNNLGIQCVKKKDVEEALRLRQEIRVDPFRTGFGHAREPGSIDLNAVRLCFQVFLEGPTKGRFTEPLTPVVSEIIYDKKAMSDLIICRLSDCSAPVSGGKEIILLCEKVVKEDIKVRFFEMKNNVTVWENYAEFSHTDVHKQVAISFRTPPYRTLEVSDPVKVYVQLERPSDNTHSEARDFMLRPLDSDLRRKRQKLEFDASPAFFQASAQPQLHKIPTPGSIPNLSALDASSSQAAGSSLPRGLYNYGNANPFQQMPKEEIKPEPGDSPSHVPSNQYQLQGLLNPQRTSPAPDRSPSTMTPSPGIAGSPSPHNQGSITPTPPYISVATTSANPFANFANFGNTIVSIQPQAQQQHQQLPQTVFDTNLPGPSNGWVQPVPLQNQNSANCLSQSQSFNLGNFGSVTLPSDPMLGLGSLIMSSGNNQSNVGPPSMGSDLMNLDFGNLNQNFNSAEIRSVLDNLSTTELNRFDQIAGLGTNPQANTGNLQQTSTISQQQQQQALRAFLTTQQQVALQPSSQQQVQQPIQDKDDNDEDLTDSFTRLSTNDLN